MSKINTPIAIILSGILIFFGLYISSNAKMSMDGKSFKFSNVFDE